MYRRILQRFHKGFSAYHFRVSCGFIKGFQLISLGLHAFRGFGGFKAGGLKSWALRRSEMRGLGSFRV